LRHPLAKPILADMGVLTNRVFRLASIWALSVAALPAWADEIRLKDGKKLYGVIVAYEDNMFKVKTDFGYVLVEKDKIASIVPATASSEAQPVAKTPTISAKGAASAPSKPETGTGSAMDVAPSATNASAKSITPNASKPDKAATKIDGTPVKPEMPAAAIISEAHAPALKGSPAAANPAIPPSTALPAPPKEPELPAIREDVQRNLYTNYTHGFRMYKAPSWEVMGDARSALPNAIVAMGTSNESSLLVVGREKTKEPLDAAAITVEKRLYDVYENYQRVSQRKTIVGGSPSVEFHYHGKADEHEWSGTLVVISRNGDIFTVLGMTYADSDLIQIQENVIAKAIGSLSFDVPEVKK
jgi:hypothetical protein